MKDITDTCLWVAAVVLSLALLIYVSVTLAEQAF